MITTVVMKELRDCVSYCAHVYPNKHDFQKQPFTNVYQTVVLKTFAEFTWKHIRPVTLLKRDSSADVSL